MPSLFFSYKHEDNTHKARVLAFADMLQHLGGAYGVSVVLDQYFASHNPAGPDEGWEIWSENQAIRSDYVLVVASRQYHEGYNLNHDPKTAPGIIPEIFIIRKRVRHDGYKPHTIRPIILQQSDLNYIPDALTHLQRFDWNGTAEIIRWVAGDKASVNLAPSWISHAPAFDQCLIANCKDVLTSFSAILNEASSKRILLILGGSGLGKTTIIGELAAALEIEHPRPIYAQLDLKGGFLERVLEPFARSLGLATMYERLLQMAPLDRFSALFNELARQRKPMVLFFDSFESGGSYAQWIQENVMPTAATDNWLRVVIAGKEVPDPQTPQAALWRSITAIKKLRHLDWHDWKSLAAKLRPELADKDVQKLFKYANGDHHAIRAVLSARKEF